MLLQVVLVVLIHLVSPVYLPQFIHSQVVVLFRHVTCNLAFGANRLLSRRHYQRDVFGLMASELIIGWSAAAEHHEEQNVLVFCKQGAHRSAFVAFGLILGATRTSPDTVCDFGVRLRAIASPDDRRNASYLTGREALSLYQMHFQDLACALGLSVLELPRVIEISEFSEGMRSLPQSFLVCDCVGT